MKPLIHPWHSIETGNDAPAVVKSIIEIPKGSKGKYGNRAAATRQSIVFIGSLSG
jgi:inorganic pyrophosphatase